MDDKEIIHLTDLPRYDHLGYMSPPKEDGKWATDIEHTRKPIKDLFCLFVNRADLEKLANDIEFYCPPSPTIKKIHQKIIDALNGDNRVIE